MTTTIKFYRNEENVVVIEKEKFEESLFIDQYVQALLAIDKKIAAKEEHEPSIVAFCGDRGEGKSSCMMTVRKMLKNLHQEGPETVSVNNFLDVHKMPEKKDDGSDVLLKDKCSNILETDMEVMAPIDPAFFDTKHNVLELVLGQMYERFLKYIEDNKEELKYRRTDKERLMGKFHDAKLCWTRISKSIESIYDPIEELDSLAAGLSLKDRMNTLIDEYLKFFHHDENGAARKALLVVCIDDLDLNISQAYEMAEQIRKYLTSPKCLLLVSLNADQLVDVVANYLDKLTAPSKDLGTQSMATKYVTKLVPLECRVIMPKIYNICDYSLEIYGTRGGELEKRFNSMKEAVVQLTYNKTRFLFYNNKGGVSPLVPNNLRGLRHLLGLLLSMSDFVDNELSGGNKNAFRAYFFQTWTRQLQMSDREFAALLVKGDDPTSVNKLVVAYLNGKIKDMEGGSALIRDISNPVNYNYNVSVGDVFYLINYLERSNVDEHLALMLFFVKSYYSMRLYEYYDVISEIEGELSPEAIELDGEVYKSDGWFKRTNMMQRFVNGSFFTYSPSDILPPSQAGKHRDLKSFNANLLYENVLKPIKEKMMSFEDLGLDDQKEFIRKFRIAEFFALTVKKSISRRKIEVADKLRRDYSEPHHLTDFNTNTKYMVFDVLSPFYNILNPKYAYDRFKYLRKSEDFTGFFEFAKSHDWSLLRRMIDYVRLKLKNEELPTNVPKLTFAVLTPMNEEQLEEAYYYLISNAVLRNGDVLSAVMEAIQSRRDNWHNKSDSLVVMQTLYGFIIDSEMRTYKNSTGVDNQVSRPYIMRFEFLNAFRELLRGKYHNTQYDIVDDTRLLNEIYSSDFDTENISNDMIMDYFSKFFGAFKTTRQGKVVRSEFAKHYEDFYAMASESEWFTMYPDDKTFKKEDIIKKQKDRFVQYVSTALRSEIDDIDDAEDANDTID